MYLRTHTFQDAVAATGNGSALSVEEAATLSIDVAITNTATVTFEATGNSGTYVSLPVVNCATGATVTTATASGLFRADVAALGRVRVRVSAYTSGSVTATGIATDQAMGNAGASTSAMPVDTELPAAGSVPSNNTEAISGLSLPFLRALLTVKDSNGLVNTSTLSGTAPSADGVTLANLLALATQSMGLTYNETTGDRMRGNTTATLLASAARTTTQTSADIVNYNARGIAVVLDMTAVGSGPSVTLTINGKDPASGKYYTLLAGAAVTTVTTNTYTVYPGMTVAANVSASAPLPRVFQIVVTANNANAGTYSVGYNLIL